VKGNKAADKVAQEHGYDDAHDAKRRRGESEVDIYRNKITGKYWLWNGLKDSGRDPL
jgi:hypothetical protein